MGPHAAHPQGSLVASLVDYWSLCYARKHTVDVMTLPHVVRWAHRDLISHGMVYSAMGVHMGSTRCRTRDLDSPMFLTLPPPPRLHALSV